MGRDRQAKARRRARRAAKRGPARDPAGESWVAGMVSVAQDQGDDCPMCLFIRARADRAGPDGLIMLDAAEVAEMQGLMRR